MAESVVILLDADNTLLDNDCVIADLRRHLEKEVGKARSGRYWTIFEKLRVTLGYTDYLGALQYYRVEYPRDAHLLTVSHFLIDYPFSARLYPEALDVIAHCKQLTTTVILTDGDVVFQPRKLERSGLLDAVEQHAFVYIHKEQELADVEQRYPADHYVMVDDKLRILTAIKQVWDKRVTTVFPRQGSYAHDPQVLATFPPADMTIAGIGELLQCDLATLVRAAQKGSGIRG